MKSSTELDFSESDVRLLNFETFSPENIFGFQLTRFLAKLSDCLDLISRDQDHYLGSKISKTPTIALLVAIGQVKIVIPLFYLLLIMYLSFLKNIPTEDLKYLISFHLS